MSACFYFSHIEHGQYMYIFKKNISFKIRVIAQLW